MEEQAKKLKEKLEKDYNIKIFTDNVELEALKQIESLAELPVFSGKKIRIMPDTHAGAGRILSRKKAYEQITIKDFRDSMKGIYSETITDFTRDEAPMVYKPAEEIKSLIGDTVDIREVIKPVFNFKADN